MMNAIHDRVFVYVWEDTDATHATGEIELKFGDHFVSGMTWEDGIKDTQNYIRDSLGRQKHKYDEGRIIIHKIWDATEYAKGKKRFEKNKKIDDVIRPYIGHRASTKGDVHRGISVDDLIARVNHELSRGGQPLPKLRLSQWQYDAAEDVIDAIARGKRTIVADLCPRFGKTLWTGVLIRETDIKLTIITSFMLTSLASCEKDLTSFEELRKMVLINAGENEWKEKVKTNLDEGKQVVVLLSACNGKQRQNRINFLFEQNVQRLIFVDEADFGVHKLNQSKPLIVARHVARHKDDIVILMTGTNADKAATHWPVDHYLSTVYPELLVEKRKTLEASRNS